MLQFGHAGAEWMDGNLLEEDGEDGKLQFGHAWAAWMDDLVDRLTEIPASASIRPRLGSVDGHPSLPPITPGDPCFNSATPGQRGWTRLSIEYTYHPHDDSIRPRVGIVDGRPISHRYI